MEKGYIQPSKSPYLSPFFFIKKKDGKLHPVQDYGHINQYTVQNNYPLPLILELINKVRNVALFTKFDIWWGCNNIRIKEGDEWKAAFKTNQGLFKPLIMYFGLTNSPSTFQTIMNIILQDLILTGDVIGYLDDILIVTTDDEILHKKRTWQVLKVLQEHDLYLRPEKCIFGVCRIEYLGVVLEKGQVHMDPIKVQGIWDWPTPTVPPP